MRHAEKTLRVMQAVNGKNVTKTELVLKHLITHKRGITPMTAYERYGLTRLGSVVYELRHHYGCEIVTEKHPAKDGSTYARYILAEVDDEAL